MNKLRKVHLYLGCIFAPMLVFFAVSGIWQTFGLHYPKGNGSTTLALVSTVHLEHKIGMKSGKNLDLSSPALRWFVIAMAVGMIMTTILGVVMAFRFGKGRAAMYCLAAGIAIPLSLICIKLLV